MTDDDIAMLDKTIAALNRSDVTHRLYYDRDGQPITMALWAFLHDDHAYKVVANTQLLDGLVTVSTVWLGLNHNWQPNGAPLIFETMIFGRYEESEYFGRHMAFRRELLDHQERYRTETEAHVGHEHAVRLVLAAIDMGDIEEAEDGPLT